MKLMIDKLCAGEKILAVIGVRRGGERRGERWHRLRTEKEEEEREEKG
ncbi:hypothetical protein [Candidatus Methanocrinis natronophilus]|uniref:Uncharacterized protein n=1 Tax=Candidatus Methanocrinis natronophilus TaxID=3033396 RepID=A0ABT5X8S5_9EURY|nr:hypothetical protein [Candidatus Methanocrinis natronophilus]MDF0591104.1 hypothetical protein [Candidatus Methanocrinis natronophilus]